jgi:hypothetical protein
LVTKLANSPFSDGSFWFLNLRAVPDIPLNLKPPNECLQQNLPTLRIWICATGHAQRVNNTMNNQVWDQSRARFPLYGPVPDYTNHTAKTPPKKIYSAVEEGTGEIKGGRDARAEANLDLRRRWRTKKTATRRRARHPAPAASSSRSRRSSWFSRWPLANPPPPALWVGASGENNGRVSSHRNGTGWRKRWSTTAD